MRRLLLLVICLGLANVAAAQLALEDFDGGTFPPPGWVVRDNSGHGSVWQTSSHWGDGNLAGGTGECAAADSDSHPWPPVDTDLITPAFDVPALNFFLEFDHGYEYHQSDWGDVDASVGGGPWIDLRRFYTHGGHIRISLDAFAGSTNVRIRFRYVAQGDRYWHVDNVEVVQWKPALWKEDFDGGIWPPAGWTVVDHAGTGNVWDTGSSYPYGNPSGGTGECAATDGWGYGTGALANTSLITHVFDIPPGAYDLEWQNNFVGSFDFGYVYISVGGGGPWILLKTFDPETSGWELVSLYDYSGATGCRFRFGYEKAQGALGHRWHVDDVTVREAEPPPPAIWEEVFNGGTFPPAGWTVFDNAGGGNVWNLSSTWTKGNRTGGSGEAAAIDDDEVGHGTMTDTELITPSFLVPGASLLFSYRHQFVQEHGQEGRVDISVEGGPWTNLHTYTDSTGGTVEVDMDTYVGNNVQIRFHYTDLGTWGWYWHVDDVRLYLPGVVAPGSPFCFGSTTSGNPCPCDNDNDGSDVVGAGCAHDDSPAGARLGASGQASVTADTLLLQGQRGPVGNSTLFFQADNTNDGAGLFLGDGIRCAGGGLIRLKVGLTDATGYADSSPMMISTRSANFGHPISPGETLYYQWWFRDVGGSPCGTESNTSNGYGITWIP